MNQFFWVIFLIGKIILFSLNSFSQKSEIGFFAGISYYLGDVNQYQHFYSPQPAFGFQYRYNINSRWNVRGSLTAGTLAGADKDFSNIFQKMRNHSFSTKLFDISVISEFHFLSFSTNKDPYTPFAALGLGVAVAPTEKSTVHFVIPAVLGMKFRMSEKFSFGLEWGIRKTFTDDIDQLFEEKNFPNLPPQKQKTYEFDTDWYTIAGIFISYKIINQINCKAYRK